MLEPKVSAEFDEVKARRRLKAEQKQREEQK
jgi:hypothetical protein